ncbi:hypothetical protein IVA79_31810 [Bradyrhizobium sp. 138]|uniref:hypothetical protein n=1 Tax=Bradyrhizobium sp. 138 TaxID=2782615 RepID=UPI001FF99B10|nr:hypothetical protein [Bradyrhizobium sp. 138]MCK1738433.1 hypothetical protein [Bradyrhizobium sp. 138]
MKPLVAELGRDLAWTAGGEGQQDDNADTVVEERLAVHLDLETFRCLYTLSFPTTATGSVRLMRPPNTSAKDSGSD